MWDFVGKPQRPVFSCHSSCHLQACQSDLKSIFSNKSFSMVSTHFLKMIRTILDVQMHDVQDEDNIIMALES